MYSCIRFSRCLSMERWSWLMSRCVNKSAGLRPAAVICRRRGLTLALKPRWSVCLADVELLRQNQRLTIRYGTIRYDSVYLMCSKSWRIASLVYHTEQTEKLKRNSKKRTKNKPMSTISPVQSHDPWRQSRGTRNLLRCEGSVEQVGFEPEVKEWKSICGLTSE